MTRRAVAAAACFAVTLAWTAPSIRDLAAQASIQVDPTELPRRVAQLEAWRAAEQTKLQASGKATSSSYKTIDDLYLIKARQMHETVRTPALRVIEQAAGAKQGTLDQGGAGTKPEFGRGAAGDVDTGSMPGRQFESVRQSAKKLDYKVRDGGDYFTIEELGTTVHREPTPYTNTPGSSAHEVAISRGYGHETNINVNSRTADANVAVLKNIEKGAGALAETPGRLMESPAAVQEVAKMTQRNMQEAGISRGPLKAQVDMLKAGYSPEAAGVVPANASPAEKAAAMGEFQRQVREVNIEALKTTQARANETLGQLRDAAAAAEGKLARARTAGNGDAIAAARQEVVGARGKAIEFQTRQGGAREALIRHSPEGAKLMTEAQGLKVELVKGPGGPRFKTPDGTKTASQLSDMLTEPPLGPPAPAASRVSRALNGIGMGLMVVGIYQGVMEAAERAGREAGERGDSTPSSVAKFGAYSVWNGLGFGWATQSGEEGAARARAEYETDVREGTVDSMSFGSFLAARARGVKYGMWQFLGLKGIEDAHAEYTAMKQELLELAVHDLQAEAALAADKKRNEDRAAAPPTPPPTRAASKPVSPPEPKKEETSVLPNLVRTSWSGEITMQVEGVPPVVLPLTLSIDSYNKISGSFPWSAWFDDEPNQRTIDVTGAYDSRNGVFNIQADRMFTQDSTISQVLSVPTGSGMGTEQKRVDVTESKRSGLRVRMTGNIDSADAARGNTEIATTSEIVVDGKSQGVGADDLRGTWRLRRTK